jgi:UDP-N-acetylglucosamine/UDP-N-acetylgalactosamine diphosphorylase
MSTFGRNISEANLIKKIINNKNGHIFYFWEELTDEQKDNLIKELSEVDFGKLDKYYDKFLENKSREFNYLKPDVLSFEERENRQFLKSTGEKSLQNGEVAYLTVAGGQATRLGFNNPKGCFPISPVKKNPLFRIFAEKIKFYSDLYNVDLKWYIMTSETNYKETKHFFIDNKYFNLNKDNVIFFSQNMIPTLDMKGRLILSDKDKIYENPDGHGGTLKALLNIGLLKEMKNHGIRYLYYFQVDNPLINLGDTSFIGYHINEKSMVTTKVIKKKNQHESLGCPVKINGSNSIIEYSDLPESLANAKDENNNPKFLMGSIGIHIFNIDFLMKFTKKLPIHYARKKITAYKFNDKNEMVLSDVDSIKFETFVFDVIIFAKRSLFYETLREEEFSPLKNNIGIDSIETCENDQIKQYFLWLKDAGFINDIEISPKIEISPLFAPDKNIFLQKAGGNTDKLNKDLFDNNGKLKNEIYIS